MRCSKDDMLNSSVEIETFCFFLVGTDWNNSQVWKNTKKMNIFVVDHFYNFYNFLELFV